jgi:hypothetical protein
MGAIKLDTSSFKMIEGILFEMGFLSLSDKKMFYKQLDSGEYMKIRNADLDNAVEFINELGCAFFDRSLSQEYRKNCYYISQRILNKINQENT